MTATLEHPFATYVRVLGKGKTGSRSLSEEEAEQAMTMILEGAATPEQIGAFLMLLRVKEESAEEISGFVQACRRWIQTHSAKNDFSIDLDWSSYAGKSRQPNWYILAILLLASAGHRIMIHGARGHTQGRVYTQDVFEYFGLPVAESWSAVRNAIAKTSFCYIPLQAFCNPLFELIQLRHQFGLRSPVHTLCRLLNPLAAPATLQSVFHPSYAHTHHQAAALLGENSAIVMKGDSGEFEHRPQAKLAIKQLCNGSHAEITIARSHAEKYSLALDPEYLRDLWEGKENTDLGDYRDTATEATIGTAALALMSLKKTADYASCRSEAETLWKDRDKTLLEQFSKN